MKEIFLICNPRTEMSLLQRAVEKEIAKREAQEQLREIVKVKEVIKVQHLPDLFSIEDSKAQLRTEMSKKQRNAIIAKYTYKYITPILNSEK